MTLLITASNCKYRNHCWSFYISAGPPTDKLRYCYFNFILIYFSSFTNIFYITFISALLGTYYYPFSDILCTKNSSINQESLRGGWMQPDVTLIKLQPVCRTAALHSTLVYFWSCCCRYDSFFFLLSSTDFFLDVKKQPIVSSGVICGCLFLKISMKLSKEK